MPGADGAAPARPGDSPTATELGALLEKTSGLAQQLLASLTGIESALSSADSARLLREHGLEPNATLNVATRH